MDVTMRTRPVSHSGVLLGVVLLLVTAAPRLPAQEPVYFQPVAPVDPYAAPTCPPEACPEPVEHTSFWDLADEELVRFRGGLTYLDRRTESHLGGTYGLDGILPLDQTFGIHWAARVNQFSGATQLEGTLGLYKTSDLASGDPIGATVFYDAFTDSRGDDFYLGTLRGQVGYAVSEIAAVGVTWTTGVNEEDNVPALIGNGIASYHGVDFGSVFVSRYFGEQLAQLGVGYREDPDSVFIDLSYRRPIIDDRTYFYAHCNYVEDSGAVASWVGIEFRFGRGSSRCGEGSWRRGVWDDPTIANAFNWGENTFWHYTNDPDGVSRQAPPDDNGGEGEGGGFQEP